VSDVHRVPQGSAPLILEARKLTKRFGAVVIADELDLSVRHGGALGIIGPNGAGKTTTLGMLSGEIAPDGGAVLLDGRDVSNLPAWKRARLGIGRTYQVPRPFGGLTVFENALVAAQEAGGLHAEHAHEAAAQAVVTCRLAKKVNTRAEDLGLIDRKQLELARALASRPSVLLLDEVAGGLSEDEVDELVLVIREVREQGISLIWIEHVVRALLAVVDELVCLDYGRVLARGPSSEVLANAAVIESYLGSPALAGDVR
jgi:branched-chain amino acid transport system ATP-binding protein